MAVNGIAASQYVQTLKGGKIKAHSTAVNHKLNGIKPVAPKTKPNGVFSSNQINKGSGSTINFKV